MRIRNRSLVIMLGQGITQVSALAVGVVLVRIISQETFGTYRQVLLVYMTLSALLSLQLDQSLYYFVPKLESDSRRALLAQTLAGALALALGAALVMLAAAGPIAVFFENPDLARLLRVFSLFPFAEGVAVLVPAWMIGLDRALRSSVYGIAKALGRFAVVVGAFAAGAGMETVLWLLIASSAAIALVGALDMLRLSGAGALQIHAPLCREQLGYAVPLWLGSVTGTLNLQYDKLLISAAFDPATYAVYFCGAIELPVVALVTGSVSAALMPSLVASTREGRVDEAVRLWQEGVRKCSLVILPCFAFFLPASLDTMRLLYGEDYAAAAGPFAIYLFLLPVRVAVYATLFRAIGRTRPVAISGLISLSVNVAVSTALVWAGRGTRLGFLGPSIGTVVADFAAAGYLLVGLRAASGLRISQLMRWAELARTLALCSAAGAAIGVLGRAALAGLPVAGRLAIEAGVFAVLLAAGFLATGQLRRDERELLRAPFGAAQRVLRRRLRA
jgi:O-antigen/teichoic acid export membrane protein